jgi:hypothetical protein
MYELHNWFINNSFLHYLVESNFKNLLKYQPFEENEKSSKQTFRNTILSECELLDRLVEETTVKKDYQFKS